MTNASMSEQDAPPGPATFDAPDADDDRPGREVTDFVARLRDGFPQKVAATDGCMINTTYALVDGDAATDEGWRTRSDVIDPATNRAHPDAPGGTVTARAIPAGPSYNGRGTEPDDGRAMTVRDDAPLFIEGPRDPLYIVEFGGQGPMTHLGVCAICDPEQRSDVMEGIKAGSVTFAADPGSARSAMAGHLRRQHNRSPWPGER